MSTYVGRHRPPTRAERRALEGRRLPKALTAGYALPTAAAATLVITAGGATAAQSTAHGTKPSLQAFAPGSPGKATAALADPQVAEQAQQDVATTVAGYSDLAQRRQASNKTIAADQGRAQEHQRAARSKQRKQLAARQEAAQRLGIPEQQISIDSSGEISVEGGWVLPLANPVFTSGFGPRWGRMHEGDDFGVPVGTPLRAMSNGTVVFAGQMSGYGTMVDIKYTDGTISRFGHMSTISVTVGQQVTVGQTVGLSGNTGRSTGPHLHLEIRPDGGAPVSPRAWLAAKGLYY